MSVCVSVCLSISVSVCNLSFLQKWGLSFTHQNAALKTEEYLDNKLEVRRDVVPEIIR